MDYNQLKSADFFYDRTRNLSGIEEFDKFSEITCPSKGSFVEFSVKTGSIDTNNNYLNIIPVGVNSLKALFNMSYEVVEEEAQKIVNYIESKEGTQSVDFDTDPTIYREINGYCTDYSLRQTDADNFLVQAVFDVKEAANQFAWTGLNFLDPPDRSNSYKPNRWNYKKHDVVYDQREEALFKDGMNSFYYCLKDHNSSDDGVDYLKDSQYFTQDFFWSPDVGQSNSVNIDVSKFGDSYGLEKNRKIKDNIATFPLEYEFKNINTKQLKSMLHFLESKGGYKRFRHQIQGVYNRPKIFVAPKWKHTWETFDSHTLQVTIEEDPLGVYPKRKNVSSEKLITTAYSTQNQDLSVSGDIPADWIRDDSSYNDLDIGLSCKNIGDYAFSNSFNIASNIVMPGSVETLGDYAFYRTSISRVVLSRSLDSIGVSCFEDCVDLVGELTIPDSVTNISSSAFKNCISFTGLNLGLDITGIGSQAFRGCKKLKTELVLPSGLLNIGNYAFASTELFGRLYIPDTVTDIGDGAFQNCRFIGDKVTIESGVQSIGGYAFNNCRAIQKLEFKGKQAPSSVSINAFQGLDGLNTRGGTKIIYAPLGSQGYDVAPWTDFSIVYQR